jgi:pimeloyl-ACP methyl ester carboxylesterase
MTLERNRAAVVPSRTSPQVVTKALLGGVIIVGVMLAILIGASMFLTYRITTAHNNVENVSPATYLLPSYLSVSFTDPEGGQHAGWLLIGLRGAPAIIVCPGYDMNRSDMLSLGAVLQANHFNVYLFNFSGPKAHETFSNLGAREAADVEAAIQKITHQPGINRHRIGLYGASVGGYAALATAERDPRVQALAVDDVYERPLQMFDVQLSRKLGGTGSVFRFISGMVFRMFTLGAPNPHVRRNLPKLVGRAKLFVAGEDVPALKATTEALYQTAPEPKDLQLVNHSAGNMASSSERKDYEDRIINFFLKNLPLRAD